MSSVPVPSVCYVLHEYPVRSQTFVHAELVALRAAGVEVGVVAHVAGDPSIRFGEGPDGEPFPLLHQGLAPSAELDAVLKRFDHLHGHFADFGVRVLQGLADRIDRPFSFMCHAYDLFRRDAAVRPEEWATLSDRCRKVVTISRFHRDFIADRGVARERIAIVPNAARLAELIENAPPPPTQLKRLLFVGRPTAKKGVPVLFEAWRRARAMCPQLDLELELIGFEHPESEPGLVTSGMRPYSEVLDAMRTADAVVAPCVVAPTGDMDGIPTVLAEACALQRPVIASKLSGIGDLVASGVNGLLVPPGDVDALAMAIVRLAQRPHELRRLGLGGPRLAACHDTRVVARRLLDGVFAPVVRDEARPRVLITDSFCSSNRGDAAILHGIVSGIEARVPDADIAVVSHFPEVTRHFHPDLEVHGDGDPVALAELLVGTDAVVSCGGSFLNDIYALNLHPRLALYHAAHRAEVPVAFFGQSMGPFDSPLSREAARSVLDGATWILARDHITGGIVADLGVRAPIEVGVDAAVPWSGAAERLEEGGPVLGITVRSWYFPGNADAEAAQEAYETHVVDAVSAWLSKTGGVARFFNNCTDFGGYRHDDRVCARRIAARIADRLADRLEGARVEVDEVADRSFAELRAHIGGCDFFLATRMHSLLFATTAGVPSFGIAYERKTAGWLALLGLDDAWVDIEDCSTLESRLMTAWSEREATKRTLDVALPKVRSRADAQFDTLASVIRGHRPIRGIVERPDLPGWQGETFKYDIAHRRLRQVVDVVLGEGGRRVLDVGCSTGLLGRMLGSSFDYTGIDVAEKVATERDGFRIVTADLNEQPVPEGEWDTVVCCGSLEYLDDLSGILASLRSRVPDGALGVFTLYNLAHFSRVVLPSRRHPTWRFDARPDELVLRLQEAGWVPRRVQPTFVGYGPSKAVNGEVPTEHDRNGGGGISGIALTRRAQQLVVVCRAGEPRPGIAAIESCVESGNTHTALRIALQLAKQLGWSGRVWNDIGVLMSAQGDLERGRAMLANALRCDAGNADYRANYGALGGSIEQLASSTDDPELRVLLDPSSRASWDALSSATLARGDVASAAMLAALRDRAVRSAVRGSRTSTSISAMGASR